MADEQIGNASIQSMTPGSAVAGQLQNILASKRLEARQAMLDQLNAQNVQSEIATRADQVETNRASREATAEWRKAQAAKSIQDEQDRLLGRYKSGQQLTDPTTIAKIRGIDPGLLQQTGGATLPSTQLGGGDTMPGAPSTMGVAPTSTPSPSVPDPSVPTQTTYLGTGDQQSDLQHELAMRAMANDPNTPASMKQWLAMSVGAKKGDVMPPASLFPPADNEVPLISFDRQGKPTQVGTTKKGAIVRQEPAPQQSNMANTPQLYQVPTQDPKDPTKTIMESHWLKPGESPSPANKMATTLIKGNPPKGPATKPTQLYDPKDLAIFQAAQRSQAPNANDLKASAVTNFVEHISDPDVKKDVKDIRSNAGIKNMSVADLVSKGILKGHPDWSPERVAQHIANVKTILDIIRPQVQ